MKAEYKRINYPSDLSDKQWEKIAVFFPSGNKSKYHKRNLVGTTMYVVKTGYQRIALPHDYPRAKQYIILQSCESERNMGKSYALIDSQSVKTAYRSDKKGYDGGKKRKE